MRTLILLFAVMFTVESVQAADIDRISSPEWLRYVVKDFKVTKGESVKDLIERLCVVLERERKDFSRSKITLLPDEPREVLGMEFDFSGRSAGEILWGIFGLGGWRCQITYGSNGSVVVRRTQWGAR
jgi:hypothetical protein